MTTEAAGRLYLAQHLFEVQGRPVAIYNPNDQHLEDLSVIYGFNNGGSSNWWRAVAMAADGTCVGGHACSNEAYMPHDLGVLEGSRTDRHEETYQKHYPDGYRMEFVSSSDIEGHKGLQKALALNREKRRCGEGDAVGDQ